MDFHPRQQLHAHFCSLPKLHYNNGKEKKCLILKSWWLRTEGKNNNHRTAPRGLGASHVNDLRLWSEWQAEKNWCKICLWNYQILRSPFGLGGIFPPLPQQSGTLFFFLRFLDQKVLGKNEVGSPAMRWSELNGLEHSGHGNPLSVSPTQLLKCWQPALYPPRGICGIQSVHEEGITIL